MITSATANTTGSSMMDVHPSTVTSKTILNVGLQMQGKDQLNNRMQEWQRRMDAHKQAERSVIANKLINERNLKIVDMAAKQVSVQEQPQYNIFSNSNVIMNNPKQIMVPIFVPLNMTFQPPIHAMASLISPCEDQFNQPLANLPSVSEDVDAIPHFPSPQEHVSNEDYLSSCDEWFLWHRTMPPATFVGSEPVSEHEAGSTYDSSLMRLDYLPFTSEDDLSNCKSDTGKRNLMQMPIDDDEEDSINVIV